jgi:type II secretory pathway predicted ATPase ExeA
LLSSAHFDSQSVLTIVLCGDGQLLELLRLPRLLPLGTRIRTRLTLEYATPKQLAELLTHLLTAAGNPRLMSPALVTTVCEHAAGNFRVLANMAAELLTEGLQREVSQLDEKLYLEVFGSLSKSRSRSDARRAAG